MNIQKQAVKKTICGVINGRVARREAAETLKVSIRTVHNYIRKYLEQGPEGLTDHRRGHYRKIKIEQERRILTCKLDFPYRSARWIRDRLKLPVSVESVRQILVKHQLNQAKLGRRSRPSTLSEKWHPL